jgi:hypothetical protein
MRATIGSQASFVGVDVRTVEVDDGGTVVDAGVAHGRPPGQLTMTLRSARSAA